VAQMRGINVEIRCGSLLSPRELWKEKRVQSQTKQQIRPSNPPAAERAPDPSPKRPSRPLPSQQSSNFHVCVSLISLPVARRFRRRIRSLELGGKELLERLGVLRKLLAGGARAKEKESEERRQRFARSREGKAPADEPS
jgi:hypothetical protein